MNDLIRRKDVEQMLASIGGCDATEEYERGFDDAIDLALSELREVKSVDRWIPCSERLPEYTSNYLVTVIIGSEFGAFKSVRSAIYNIKTGWHIDKENNEIILDVIAWKELSKPWEGE